MTQLSDSALVMIWRRVEDLDQSETLLRENGITWPVLGKKITTALFDGDSALFGVWKQNADALTAELAARVDFEASDMILNPSSELIVRSPSNEMRDIANLVKTSFSSEANIYNGEVSQEVSFSDPSGNVFSFARQHVSVPMESGTFFINDTLHGNLTSSPIIGIRRVVSSLQRSTEYYRDVIQMPLVGGVNELRFASGLCNVSLLREDYVGGLQILRNRNRLVTDWIVLRVTDLEQTLRELTGMNVIVRNGIEQTRYGPLLHISDPDGHSIVFWQEPDVFPDGERDVKPFVRSILERAQRRANV